MSEVAAVLLMFLGEEDAFWALAQLMVSERHAMHGRWALRTAGRDLAPRRVCLHSPPVAGLPGDPHPIHVPSGRALQPHAALSVL